MSKEIEIIIQNDGTILIPAEVGKDFIDRVLKPIASDPNQLDNFVEMIDGERIIGDSVLCG